RLEAALDGTIILSPGLPEAKDFLHRDDVTFHSGQFGHAEKTATTVREPANLNDDVDRRGDLIACRSRRDIDAAHADHLLDARQRVARRVGVDRRHRSLVTGVHRLQHVERLARPDLADDDAVRPHAQRVLDQIPLADLALALDVGGPRLEPDDVTLLEL